MNPEIKLIFDECLGGPMMDTLKPFLERAGRQLLLKSVTDYYKQGIPDRVWIPQVASEGGWIVLSADHGRSGNEKYEDRLPYLCRKHRVTHVLLSPTVHKLRAFEKGKAIVAVWSDFSMVEAATRGTRFAIRFNSNRTRFLLLNIDLPNPPKQGKGPPV